jgi:PAS domain S-box-containing protein
MTATAPVIVIQKRILVVEDEALIAMDLKQRLKRLGYVVTSIARNADDAFSLALSQNPDLILMDIHLDGDKDGIHAAEEIRKTLDIPVVYLTAHSDSFTLERAKITGPFGYITKPFETDTLRVQIEIALFKHRTEQKLRQSEMWLSTTLRNVGDAVIATDRDGRIEFMNPVAEALSGWTMEEASGESSSEVFRMLDPRTGERVANPVLRLLTADGLRALSGEYNLRSRNGSVALVQMLVSANKDEDGRLLGLVIVFRDITAQRELERRAEESRKMEAIALMAGGLAHDFNDLLMVILDYVDVARSDPGETADALNEIRRAGESAAVLCQQLLTVSRDDVVEGEIFDLNEPIAASTKMLRRILGPACSLVVKPCSESLPVASNPTQIQQVLIYLVAHARDAMPQGGTFTISTRRGGSGRAEIDVRDTGIGMTEETKRRIFDPFFSWKGRRGSGLAMTVVHSLVTKWSGTIEVKSEPGLGTEFRVSFPLCGMPAGQTGGFQPELMERPVTGNILLVDGNAAVREFLHEQLDSSGFRIFEASSGEEALAFAELGGEKVDLLITNVTMPAMTGPELAKRWVDRWPETQVLFMSGYDAEELGGNDLIKSGRAEFVVKPVKPKHMISIVGRMLARKPSRG